SLAQQDLLDSHVEKIKKAIDSAELKFVLCDINSDGKISIVDARLALKAVVGSYALNETQTLAADVNGDGKVSIADSRAILKSVVNK
ncbi:MAG: dockerin type I repeat-containing protein, partial [Clostridia bacterium]|nr:dockerin type I repeat-containing protein [Clostridia bacterium]